MLTRQQIGQAVGILRERYHLDPDSAFNYLRRMSQNGNVKLRDLAADLVNTGHLPDEPGR
jgi:AmiR/NasT family two-component response regulator